MISSVRIGCSTVLQLMRPNRLLDVYRRLASDQINDSKRSLYTELSAV